MKKKKNLIVKQNAKLLFLTSKVSFFVTFVFF